MVGAEVDEDDWGVPVVEVELAAGTVVVLPTDPVVVGASASEHPANAAATAIATQSAATRTSLLCVPTR